MERLESNAAQPLKSCPAAKPAERSNTADASPE
jgi:hypothetical protein